MSKKLITLVSIVLVTLMLTAIFVETTSAVHTGVGTLEVYPTSWNPLIKPGYSEYKVITVSTNSWEHLPTREEPGLYTVHGVIKGVTVEKISGPAWLKIEGETNLGDITHPESKKFTIRASPPEDIECGTYPYKVKVSCTSGHPSYLYIEGEIKIYGKGKGTLEVNPTSWNPKIKAGYSVSKVVTVSTNSWEHLPTREEPGLYTVHGVIKGVTVEKISGPAWLKIEGETNLGDITHPESKKFTIRASPPKDMEGTFPYKIRVSCTFGDPSYIDIQGEVTVSPLTPTPVIMPSSSPLPSQPLPAPPTPGFEALFAIAGLLTAVAYLIRRQRVK